MPMNSDIVTQYMARYMMRFKIPKPLFILLLLSAFTELCAQNVLYVHGGIGLSSTRAAFTDMDFNKLNVLAGAGIMMPTDDEHFYFGLEGNIAQKGNRTVNPTPGVFVEQTRADLFYLQMPAYAAYRFDAHWSVFLGPALGVLLFSTESNLFTPQGTPANFRTFELSGLLGAKYEFAERWGVMGRFEHSLISVMDVPAELRRLRGGRRYHAVATLSFFYKFGGA